MTIHISKYLYRHTLFNIPARIATLWEKAAASVLYGASTIWNGIRRIL